MNQRTIDVFLVLLLALAAWQLDSIFGINLVPYEVAIAHRLIYVAVGVQVAIALTNCKTA